MTDIAKRLARVRQHMSRLGLDALIVPRADEYLGEYIPERNERLRWISGFTGSAGVVIVLQDRAVIFVDGRYTVQVARQVPEDLFEVLHLIEEPHLPWLAGQLKAMAEARDFNHSYVGTEHLLLGLLREEKGIAAQVLNSLGVGLDEARSETLKVLGSDVGGSEPAGSMVGRIKNNVLMIGPTGVGKT